MNNLVLDGIVNVVVSKTKKQIAREGYNIGLIVGGSARFSQTERVREFKSLVEMKDFGYVETDPEYIAAKLYFGQSKTPDKVCIARYCPNSATESATAVKTGTITSATVTVATFAPKIGSIDGAYVFIYNGGAWRLNGNTVDMTEYGISVVGSPADNDTVTVTYVSAAEAESIVTALIDARAKNYRWFGVYLAIADLTDNDVETVAEYVETIKGCLFFDSSDATAITTATSDIFSVMKDSGINHACGIYSETLYAGAAVMGYAMGANNGENNSAFTLAYKTLNGVEVTDITENQVQILRDKNANYFIKRGGSYLLLENGVTSAGMWFDEFLGTEQLAADLQRACMDVLVNAGGKVPYTDSGTLAFVLACNDVCEDSVRQGFLTAGIWDGEDVLECKHGDTLETGYRCMVEPVAAQTAEDRAARKAPPIYVCAILAGAIHSVTIRVDVE